jgi:hypothetical protein
MEPRSFKRGNSGNGHRSTQIIRASMEPRSFKRGNETLCEQCNRDYAASMEPRSFKRGNNYQDHPYLRAPIPLQWSHAHSSVETFQV